MRKVMNLKRSCALSAFAMLACMANPAASQDTQAEATADEQADDGGDIGEIVVSARRRNEKLQDVPISVTAFDQASLDNRAIRAIDDLARISPGITFTRNGAGSSANYNDQNSDIAIRGISSNAGSTTTGIYIDDTPIQGRRMAYGTVNAFPALFDVGSVEVLRGPQGTLFGSGSEGGVVRFVNREPSLNAWSVYGRAEVSQVDGGGFGHSIGASVGGPLVQDKVAIMLSASKQREAGWVDRISPFTGNITEKNANWQETVTARAALKFAASDELTITPSFYFQQLKIHDTASYWRDRSSPKDNVFLNANVLTNSAKDPFYLAAMKVEWKPDFADFSWVSSYFHRNQSARTDYTQYNRTLFSGATPVIVSGDAGVALFEDKQRNWVQELKVSSKDGPSPLKWTVGVFWSRTSEDTPEFVYDPTLDAELGPLNPVPGPGGQVYNQPVFKLVDKQIALFGEFNYQLTPTLTVTAGARWSSIKSEGEFAAGGAIVFADFAQSSGKASESNFAPRFILNYQPNPDHTLYVSASKGFRPGGLNFEQVNTCAKVNPHFNSDSLWSYEVGSKNVFRDAGLTLNASAFFIDWRNLQQNVFYPACDFQQTVNLGGVHSRGFEIEGQLRPTDGLTLGLTANYTKATYTETVANPLVSKGDYVPGSPFNLTFTVDYEAPDNGGIRPYFHGDFQFASKQAGLTPYSNPADFLADPTVRQVPNYSTTGVRFGIKKDNFDLSVFATNLLNSHPVLFESRDLPIPTVDLYFSRTIRPRTFGLTLSYRN